MQKKYYFGSLVAFLGIISIWQVAANAQTWTGPKANCEDPGQTDCNVDGVVWNRANFATAPVQTGNYKLNGSAQIGGDFFFAGDAKALIINKVGATSTLNLGNWDPGNATQYPSVLNVYGSINAVSFSPRNPHPQITGYSVKGTNNLCIGTDCRTTWPSGGGGGGTVTSVGTVSGGGLTGGPITTSGNLSLITTCSAGQLLKFDGTKWACANDTDTNSGGTIGTITSPDTSITVTNGSGPSTGLALNTTLLDGRYVNVTGDTMTGPLTLDTAGRPYALTVNGGNGGTAAIYGNNVAANGYGGQFYGSYGVYATTPNDASGYYAGYFDGYAGGINAIGRKAAGVGVLGQNSGAGSYGVEGYAVNGYGGYFTNNTTYSYLGGSGYGLLSNGAVYTSGDVTGARLCIGADCRNAWPSGGSGTITGVTAGTNMTGGGTSGNVTLNVTDNWVNTTGDTMSGALTVSGQFSSASQIDATGANAGYRFFDRANNGFANWVWYANNLQPRLWNSNTGDVLTLNTAGQLWLKDGILANNEIYTTGDLRSGGKVILTAGDKALLTVGWDAFTSGKYNGLGSWGLFMEPSALTIGVPNTAGKSFRIAKYGVNSNITKTVLATDDQNSIWVNDLKLGTSGLGYLQPTTNNIQISYSSGWMSWIYNGAEKFKFNMTNGAPYNTSALAWGSISDARTKKDIEDYSRGLDLVTKVRPVTFEYNGLAGTSDDGIRHVGVIAQEVPKESEFMVQTIPVKLHQGDTQDTEILAIDSTELSYALVNSVKELKSQNDMLQAENDALLKRIEALEAKIQ